MQRLPAQPPSRLRCSCPWTQPRSVLHAQAWQLACLTQASQSETVLQHPNGASVHVFSVTHRQLQVRLLGWLSSSETCGLLCALQQSLARLQQD